MAGKGLSQAAARQRSLANAKRAAARRRRKKAGMAGGMGGGTGTTHADLDLRFHAIGNTVRKSVPAGYKPLSDPVGHKSGIFVVTLARSQKGSFSKRVFNSQYRRSLPRHDEILSTASVRAIVSGAITAHSKKALKPAEIDAVNKAVNDLSRVRMKTGHVGYAFSKTDTMQHPTAISEAVFAHPHQTSWAHSFHDIKRRAAAADEAEAEVKNNSKATIVSVTRAALRGAILYTLNEMTAAASASDVHPFLRISSARRGVAQVEDRETLKVKLVELGGTVRPDDPSETTKAQRLGRRSRTARGTREASPFRG